MLERLQKTISAAGIASRRAAEQLMIEGRVRVNGKVVTELAQKVDGLDKFPETGRMVPEIMNADIREIIVYSYRVIYDISENDIQILTIIHAKRNFDDAFGG